MKIFVFLSALALTATAFAQSPPADTPAKIEKAKKPEKGAGNAASGAAKGAADLVTLHPIGAATAMGTGAVKAGKDVTVGSVKGAGKIGKGAGQALKKIF